MTKELLPVFSTQVKILRTKLGISQELLAHAIGVSFATINRWEKGHRQPLPMARRAFEAFCKEKGVKI